MVNLSKTCLILHHRYYIYCYERMLNGDEILKTRHSSYGIGTVIFHIFPDKSKKPIAFASRTLSKSERNYSQLDKVVLTIRFGIKKFNQYLFGRKSTISTGNKALSLSPIAIVPALAASRLVRWTLTLAAYDYNIELKTTRAHANVDMLSRLPVHDNINRSFINDVNDMQITWEQMQPATLQDRVVYKVVEHLKSGKLPDIKNLSSDLKPYFEKNEGFSVDGIIVGITRRGSL